MKQTKSLDAMKNFFGGLLGAKKQGVDVLEALIENLDAGKHIETNIWTQCLQTSDLEEALEDLPRDRKLEIQTKNPGGVFSMLVACIAGIEATLEFLRKEEDLTDELELKLSNNMVVFIHFLSVAPVSEDDEVFSHLWEKEIPKAGCPLGVWALQCAMRVLFLPDFTVLSVDPEDAKKNNDDVEAFVNGVEVAVLWGSGVGPERESNEKDEKSLRENRELALRFLLVLLCGDTPACPPNAEEGAEDNTPNQGREKIKESLAAAEKADKEVTRQLFFFQKPLRYICDPQKEIPRRAELFYSLLSMGLKYDPHGFNIPYGSYFSGDKEEQFVQTCFQTIACLLLDFDDEFDHSNGRVDHRPQEQPGRWRASTDLLLRPHVFRDLLAGISDEAEIRFIINGISKILGTSADEKNTFLPRSMRLPLFLAELLILAFHLAACEKFVRILCTEEEIIPIIEDLFQFTAAIPEHIHEDTGSVLVWGIIMRLTSYREVCIACTEESKGALPDYLPEVSGSGADVIIVAALQQMGDYFLSSRINSTRTLVSEACLSCVVNLSPFVQSLALESCCKLFGFLERCMKAASSSRQRYFAGAALLPGLLETVVNILQYQYNSNEQLAYGIMARNSIFNEFKTAASNAVAVAANAVHSNGMSEEGHENNLAAQRTPVVQWNQLFEHVEDHLQPILFLLEAIVPELEAAVDQKDLSNPEDVKNHLPRSIVGLMPAPRTFVMRSLKCCLWTHRFCEHTIISCVAAGPLSDIWDADEDDDDKEGSLKKREQRQRRDRTAQKKQYKVENNTEVAVEGPEASLPFNPPGRGVRAEPQPASPREPQEAKKLQEFEEPQDLNSVPQDSVVEEGPQSSSILDCDTDTVEVISSEAGYEKVPEEALSSARSGPDGPAQS